MNPSAAPGNAPPRVAVIDIGSNSIKSLVAAPGPAGEPVEIEAITIDARISSGIAGAPPLLGEAPMARALEAIRELLAAAARHHPSAVALVATSAVRDAENGADFRRRVLESTGHDVRILTGRQEADLIGRGAATDPALAGLDRFALFDLGGGSLECLRFHRGRAEAAVSLPLGCVRLMERFVQDPSAPFSCSACAAVTRHVAAGLAGGFPFDRSGGETAVGTGGTLTCARAVLAARDGRTLAQTGPAIPVARLRELLEWLGGLPLARRLSVPGLPPRRADVFPVALATLLAVADAGAYPSFHHSLRNLRWGLAAELLAWLSGGAAGGTPVLP